MFLSTLVCSATEGSVEVLFLWQEHDVVHPCTRTHTCDQDKEAFKGIYQYPPAAHEKRGEKEKRRAQRSNKREQRTSWSDFQTETLNTWSSPAIGFGDYPAPMSPLYIIKSQISSSLVCFWQKFLHDHRQCAKLSIYLLLTLLYNVCMWRWTWFNELLSLFQFQASRELFKI